MSLSAASLRAVSEADAGLIDGVDPIPLIGEEKCVPADPVTTLRARPVGRSSMNLWSTGEGSRTVGYSPSRNRWFPIRHERGFGRGHCQTSHWLDNQFATEASPSRGRIGRMRSRASGYWTRISNLTASKCISPARTDKDTVNRLPRALLSAGPFWKLIASIESPASNCRNDL